MLAGEKGDVNSSCEDSGRILLSSKVMFLEDNPSKVLDLPKSKNFNVVAYEDFGGYGDCVVAPLTSRRNYLEIYLTPSPLKYGVISFHAEDFPHFRRLFLPSLSQFFVVVIDDGLETLQISSIRSRNVTVRKQARKKMGKSKAKDDIERSFFNPKVPSLFYKG